MAYVLSEASGLGGRDRARPRGDGCCERPLAGSSHDRWLGFPQGEAAARLRGATASSWTDVKYFTMEWWQKHCEPPSAEHVFQPVNDQSHHDCADCHDNPRLLEPQLVLSRHLSPPHQDRKSTRLNSSH